MIRIDFAKFSTPAVAHTIGSQQSSTGNYRTRGKNVSRSNRKITGHTSHNATAFFINKKGMLRTHKGN